MKSNFILSPFVGLLHKYCMLLGNSVEVVVPSDPLARDSRTHVVIELQIR